MFTKAKYILRFDDICPTMNWNLWEKIENLLVHYNIKPILAVIPDVKDPELLIENPKNDFWDRVKEWKKRGWSIALHGYQHKFVTKNTGDFSKLFNYSEFAGLPYEEQKIKIEKAIDIFRTNGIEPDLWIAPASSFDKVTLKILKENKINITSCGFYLKPVIQDNFIFIPQQLWWFRWVPFGLWTIAFHHNFWDDKKRKTFEIYLKNYAKFIISLKEALIYFPPKKVNILDKGFFYFYTFLVKGYSFICKIRGKK